MIQPTLITHYCTRQVEGETKPNPYLTYCDTLMQRGMEGGKDEGREREREREGGREEKERVGEENTHSIHSPLISNNGHLVNLLCLEDLSCLLAGSTFIDSDGTAQGEGGDRLAPPPLCPRRNHSLDEPILLQPLVINKLGAMGERRRG